VVLDDKLKFVGILPLIGFRKGEVRTLTSKSGGNSMSRLLYRDVGSSLRGRRLSMSRTWAPRCRLQAAIEAKLGLETRPRLLAKSSRLFRMFPSETLEDDT
jgi:hypothetical protein